MNGLIAGGKYSYKVFASTIFGTGVASVVTTIYAAGLVTVPGTPTTEISGSSVIISWGAPSSDGGVALTYTITIQRKTGAYASDLTNCDGANAAIIAQLYCVVPVASLKLAPFYLVTGSAIKAIVTATNAAGTSPATPAGGSAVIP